MEAILPPTSDLRTGGGGLSYPKPSAVGPRNQVPPPIVKGRMEEQEGSGGGPCSYNLPDVERVCLLLSS